MESSLDPTIHILSVEDHPGDIRLTKEAFHHHDLIRLHHAWDGNEAMAFLRREGIHAAAPRPALIIMDLNLPKMNGREALALIKNNPALSAIPIVILTNSEREEDVIFAMSITLAAT